MSASLCEFLPWDSGFFNCRIGRVKAQRLYESDLEQIGDWAQQERIDCLYLLADPGDPRTIRLAEQSGFRLVDVRLTYQHPPGVDRPAARDLPSVLLRPSQPGDIPELEALAGQLFTGTRFFFDDRFPPEAGKALYQTWIRSSVEGYADCVTVAEAEGRIAGFITAHLPAGDAGARIGLVGVASFYRGAKVGQRLVNAVLEWFHARAAGPVFVSTQAHNIPAQRLYQSCGFLAHSTGIWYHKWLTDCIPQVRKS
jgi:GNAT superfamily N-acetyltransferase